jgi:electron transfer flavoprotein alpha subunit
VARVLTIVAGADADGLTGPGLQALAVAKDVADSTGSTVEAVLLVPSAAATQELAERGCDTVYGAEGARCDNPLALAAGAAARSGAEVIIASHGPELLQILPRLAARLGAGCVMQATSLTVKGPAIEVVAAVYGGAARATYSLAGDGPRIVGLAPIRCEPPPRVPGRTTNVVSLPAPADPRVRVVTPASRPEGARLEDARVVVSGGRGLKDRENYVLIRELAASLSGMPGASRAIVDDGWARPAEQVGLTGAIVSPDLYFAIGVSGASQHMAGCSNSRVLVAINTDPDAPIFRYATYGIVGDCLDILPELIRQANQLAGGG